MSRNNHIEAILELLPPAQEGFTEQQARAYLDGLSPRKVKNELNNLQKYVATLKKTSTHH